MTYIPINPPFQVFTDLDGKPLEAGFIYIGEENENPVTNPIEVFWDSDGAYPAAQPIRTLAGYPSRNGTSGNIFINLGAYSDYSILIRNKRNELIYQSTAALLISGKIAIFTIDTFDQLRSIEGYGFPVYLRGHTSIVDGGFGWFEYISGQPAGTFSDDDGITAVPTGGDGSAAWIRQFTGAINAKWFNAVGDGSTDDTIAIDNMFDYLENHLHYEGTAVNGSRDILLVTDAPTLYFPAGEYVYNGTGYIPIDNKVIVIKGQSPESTTIRIDSDYHFVHPTTASKVMTYIEFSDLKIIGGRGAFFNEKTDTGNVAHGKRVYNCIFAGYTSVAFGSIQVQDARWTIRDSFFDGSNTGTPVGLYLPQNLAEADISGNNSFTGNKYDIILHNDAIAGFVIGPGNAFFNLSGRTKEADIWLQPGDTSNGQGVRFIGNRHSNENLDPERPNFLIADRDGTTDSHVFSHLTTLSSNALNGLMISDCYINSTGNPVTEAAAVGYIYSFTGNVSGLRFLDNHIGQWRP